MTRTWRLPLPVVERVLAGSWHGTADTDGAGVSRWAPLVQVGPHGKWLGVGPGGDWLIGTLDRPRPLSEGWHVPLLPILEGSYSDWTGQLLRLRRVSPEAAEALDTLVPILPLLRAAIDGEGDYWPDLALSWLEKNPELPRPHESLQRLAGAGRQRPQRLRHRAEALLRSSRRAPS